MCFYLSLSRNSPLNLAGMAVERYIAICLPLHHVRMCTVRRAYALIALIWGVSFIPAASDIIIVLATQPLSVYSRTFICYNSNLYNTQHHQAQRLVVQVKYSSVWKRSGRKNRQNVRNGGTETSNRKQGQNQECVQAGWRER